ncbi:hypothetical protein EI555_001855 [Monodon monoceros]|uniref:Uncharacterized protein n=1 Tax=Monodon monoceros TaxID=40151 RepID=A0A4U1FCM6_MONMO|nr:hypothetical protein EI555_001855 [Monodon monoceros]
MLNSIFNFYYVKAFLHLYKISEVAFYQVQMILMIWNALNDLSGTIMKVTGLVGFTWWYHYVLLIARLPFFSKPSVYCLQKFSLDISLLIKINQVASLVGSTSILFCGLISDNMEILLSFQAITVIMLFLLLPAFTLACTTQILIQKNFCLFLTMNFFQVFHLTFFSNFMMISVDNLIPKDVLPSSIRGIRLYLPTADVVNADLLKFNWQSPLSSMVFGINALFTKPAQSLAPMMILSRLNQYGYGNPNER